MNQTELRILLADDDEDDRLFFKSAMEVTKIKTIVNIVNNGVELMKYLFDTNTILPHLLFLDLNMPIKSGVECLKEIRNDNRFKDMMIAIYSTSASNSDVEETFVNGANIYIKKPDDFNTLKNTLSKVITINWQYQTSGLNKENFLLSI